VVKLFELAQLELPFEPRFNIAPTQQIAAVHWNAERQERELVWLHWGLIPPWAADRSQAAGLINARAETVASKPAFRDAFRQCRCLIPADGFYEWKREHRSKQPYYISLRDDRPFASGALAALAGAERSGRIVYRDHDRGQRAVSAVA
jgi:putative SOS response-associated peptidase YedK